MNNIKKIKVNCETCGLEMARKPSKVRRAKHIFCVECSKKYNKERMIAWNKKNNPLEWHRKTALKMENHPNFKGFTIRKDGYVRIAMGGDKRKLYHRHIVEDNIGRQLNPVEIIHHIDGNPSNNNIDNLAIMNQGEHARLHFAH